VLVREGYITERAQILILSHAGLGLPAVLKFDEEIGRFYRGRSLIQIRRGIHSCFRDPFLTMMSSRKQPRCWHRRHGKLIDFATRE